MNEDKTNVIFRSNVQSDIIKSKYGIFKEVNECTYQVQVLVLLLDGKYLEATNGA